MTLAHELEDLEARRRAGTISAEDAARAKETFLGAGGTINPASAGHRPSQSRLDGGMRTWLLAGLLSNSILLLAVIALLALAVYWLLPLAMAGPLLICLIFVLPVFWLMQWFGGL